MGARHRTEVTVRCHGFCMRACSRCGGGAHLDGSEDRHCLVVAVLEASASVGVFRPHEILVQRHVCTFASVHMFKRRGHVCTYVYSPSSLVGLLPPFILIIQYKYCKYKRCMWKHKWPKYIDPVPVAVGDADGLLCSLQHLAFWCQVPPTPFLGVGPISFWLPLQQPYPLYSSPIPYFGITAP